MSLVSPFIRGRIEQYAKNEIRFNLMAIIKNRADVLQQQIAEAEQKKERLLASLGEMSLTDEQKERVQSETLELEDLILRSIHRIVALLDLGFVDARMIWRTKS